MRHDAERLRDILEAIERILRYTKRGRDAFNSDELVQTWIVHHLQIIGEACREISRGFRSVHPEVPWIQIAGMRNVLVHAYFSVNLDRVWAAAEKDVPDLKSQITRLLEAMPPPAGE